MTHDIRFVSDLSNPDAYHALMVEYFVGIVDKLRVAGGPELDAATLADATVANIADTLPPNGRLAFALDADGQIVGTGAFRLVGNRSAEFKRMFVRPEAQGIGLGRRLFQARIAEARSLGCQRIVADTVKGNVAMLSLYDSYGFRRIPRYRENYNPPDLDPFLEYLEYILPDPLPG